ncbi:MAG: copper amine oxidase N-terminal domain-containing protein [Defluviitaleaceae bacterium]|nr:copper amine oxidase N-terminal domain-containing protein [Defluviitaleaceae bacterium]
MRFVFEALGFDVHWNDETREAFFSKDEKTVRVVVGSEFIYVNEEQYKICGSGEIIAWLANDRIMLPLASVRYFGYAVEWVPGGDFVRTIFNLVPESEFTTGIFDIEPFTSTIIFTPGSGTGNPRAVTHTFFYPIKLWSPHYAGLQWNFSNGSGVFDGWLLIKPSDTLICTGDSREEWDGTVFREDAEVTFSEDVTLAARWSF